jgi:hypothetical protein
MNALAVVPFCLSLFFLRDCFLLRMGPARLLSIRLRRYTVVFLATVLLVSGAMRRLGDEPLQLARASRLILVIAGFYALLAAICLWIRRTDRHHLAWILAAAPNPILAFSIVLLARTMFPSASVYAVMAGSGFLAFVWIGLIVLWLRRTTQARMDVPDLDFSIGFASFVNSIALLLLPADFLLTKWGSG